MNGLLVINKPAGFTSHDVVNKLRRVFNTKQIGHLGTLDPDATGVLVICVNEATKLVPYLESDEKEYLATSLIGKSTDTYDLSGEVQETMPVVNITNEMIDQTLTTFHGEIKQIPPMYSAIKVKGKKLYEYARKNQTVEVEPRLVTIKEIKRLTDLDFTSNEATFDFQVTVSKGTYIRSLCFDIAKALGYPGLMAKLVRTRSGSFTLENSYTLEQVENGDYQMVSMLEAMSKYPSLDNQTVNDKARHGMKISLNMIKELMGSLPEIIVLTENGNILAIYLRDDTIHCYKAGRVWN